MPQEKPIAIYFEHPDWFEPLFAALDQRGVFYRKVLAPEHTFDPAIRACPYSLLVNRMSAMPSARSHPALILYVQQYLAYLDSIQARVINGYASFLVGASKARQMGIFEQVGVRYPRSRVIYDQRQIGAAAADLTFPILVKPNAGGSGAGIRKFNSPAELDHGINNETLALGIDHTALVQEYLPPKGNQIIRVEILNGQFLYAIRLPIIEDNFNYCPADGCNITTASTPAIQSYSPPPDVIETVKKIMSASRADLGGVEYLINDRDNHLYYYDVNPLSNFVADALNVVGFDPIQNFVDFILGQTGR